MVDILMAVYNGEKYIGQQIESILSQSYTEWRLFINDDCSTDKTFEIAKKYADKYTDKVFVTKNDKNMGSAGANFFNMIKNSTGDIIMTCDQDDIWLKDKIKLSVEALQNETMPVLIHTDLKIVDANCNVISSSMIKTQHIDVNRTGINQLIVQNIVTGCTMAFNRKLADIIKIPKDMPVHDWYIALVASLFGKIKFIDEAAILYRQHGNNYCGAADMESAEYIMSRLKDSKRAENMLKLGYHMAGEILRLYNIDNKMLREYSKMDSFSKLKKLRVVFKYKIWKNGIVRKLGQLWFM